VNNPILYRDTQEKDRGYSRARIKKEARAKPSACSFSDIGLFLPGNLAKSGCFLLAPLCLPYVS
jgi:hypothetical protein